MTVQNRNIGALIKTVRAIANTALTAAGSGDNTAVTGAIIDRALIGSPLTGVLAIPYTATLAEGETLTLTYTVAEGAESDLSDAATLKTAAVVVATGGAGGSTETGCLEVDLNLSAAGRYVRANVTPDLSASGTDTAAISGVIITAGADRGPQ